MTFNDWQLNLVTFQAWRMKFLNSMIFQVFHDQYKPYRKTDCSLLAEACFPWYFAGGRKRGHLLNTREWRSLLNLVPRGILMLGNSGGGLYPRGEKAHSQSGKIPTQDWKIKTIYIGLRRIPLNCIHHWGLPQNMGLPPRKSLRKWV